MQTGPGVFRTPLSRTQAPDTRFREVVLPHLVDALALARWLTGSSHDAEDVVQDACVKAFAGIGTYAGGNARAWLLAIVRNSCATWLARNRPRSLVLVGGLAELEEEHPGTDTDAVAPVDPESALILANDDAALENAIAGLPHRFREIVVLRDVNGLSYREIAAMLDVPIGTVMSRLSRARSLLIASLRSSQ